MSSTLSSTPSSVEVSTTQPVHKNLPMDSSERLVFRPLLDSDFPAYCAIFKEEPKDDREESSILNESSEKEFRDWFDHTQTHCARVGIFLKNSDGTEGDLIGEGGVMYLDNKYGRWPEIFYQLKKEFWSKGYATEFVKKFLGIWWNLLRKNTRIRVQQISLGSQHASEVKEQLGAEIIMSNKGSIRVVEKAGFEFCGVYLGDGKEYGYWRYISPN